MEVSKGRTELRSIRVSDEVATLTEVWSGLAQLICVHRVVRYKGRTSEEWAYYISSQKKNALYYHGAIRSHWNIENTLHYVKDVVLLEDKSRIRKGNAPQNLSTIKNIAINLLRTAYDKSLTKAIRMAAHNIKALAALIL